MTNEASRRRTMLDLRLAAAACALSACGAMSGCASLDAMAVAETHRLGDAPYYVEIVQPQPAVGSCAIVLPATLDPGFGEAFGLAGREAEFAPLLAALNARIESRSGCIEGVREPAGAANPPRVYVGSADSDYAPLGVDEQPLPGERFAPMILQLERPGVDWSRDVAGLIARSGASYAVVIQLGVSQYGKGYSGVFTKEVVLGTGYRERLKFLTAEDKPVEVLHLTGVLVGSDGKVVRAGAEGIVLRDTPFLAQAIDVTRTFDPEELRRVLDSERRNDLPGAPLKLEVALDNLVAQLTRSEVRVPAPLRRFQRVLHQDRDGHRTHASRHRRDPASAFPGGFELHVAHELAVRHPVDADVDDHRARPDPLARDQPGLAYRDDEQLGALDVGPQVTGEAVAHRHRRAGEQQLERHRPADEIRRTHDDRVLPLGRDTAALEQPDHPVGSARPHQRVPEREPADVVGMEPVHVLGGGDCLDDDTFVDVVRQRNLHEDAVDRLVRVELADQAQQLRLRRGVGQVVAHRHEPALLAGGALVSDVDLRGRVVADEHDREPGATVTLRGEPVGLDSHLAPDVGCDRLAVDDLSRHPFASRPNEPAFWHDPAAPTEDLVFKLTLGTALRRIRPPVRGPVRRCWSRAAT
jgi:hypothetical protein